MKSLKEHVIAVENALLADWKKSWSVFVVWSLLLALIANLGVGPLAPPTRHAEAALANLTGVTAIAADAAGSHTLALKSDGTVLAWGLNGNGQIGNDATAPQLSATPVTGLGSGSGITAIAVGSAHSLALKSDGTVLAWGANDLGQLGDGTTTQRTTPVLVSNATGVTAISAGINFSLALKSDGTILAWGTNTNGQLGDGTTTQRNTPVQVTGSATGITAISAGNSFAVALTSEGGVIAWGSNSTTALGDGTTTQRNSPVQTTGLGSGSGVTAISAGNTFTLALKSDGTVLAWGNNANGQLGDSTTTGRSTPVQVSGLGSGSGVTAIAASSAYSLALKSDGTALSWGANNNGQLGDGTLVSPKLTPGAVSDLSGASAIAGGAGYSVALKSDGTVLAWGTNSSGQLGAGTIQSEVTAAQVTGLGSGSGITAIAANGTHSLALKSDGTMLAWGNNGSGQLGDGTQTQRNAPVAVGGLASGITAIAAGGTHSLARKSDGTLLAWGNNVAGALGDGTTTVRTSPVQVTGSATGMTAVSAGGAHSIALKSDGTVLAWGPNINGQLGDGSTSQRNTPVQVIGSATGIVAIVAPGATTGSGNHNLAITSASGVIAWGLNSNGQLGDGATTQRTSPFQVDGLGSGSGIMAVAAGSNHSLALKTDGTVLAWGGNANGQLGDGTMTQRTTPVPVSGLGSGSGVIALAAGQNFSLALKSDGTVLAWGLNSNGQLGDGTLVDSLTPKQVTGFGSGSGVTRIAAGQAHVLALKSDGAVLAWGANGTAQLGNSAVFTANLTPANVRFETGSGGASGSVAPAVQVSQPNGGEFFEAGSTKLILWGGQGSQIVSARIMLSTDGGTTYPDVVATTMSGSGYWLWTVPSVNTEKARIKVEFLSVDGQVFASDASDADFTIFDPAAPEPEPAITGGEGSGTSTAIVEGTDTSASGQGALTREEANLKLPPEFPVDSLVKLEGDSAVYYIGLDAKRHPFINAAAYHSWYPNFDGVEEIGLASLITIPLGAPILARPGTHWVKIASDEKTYYVEPGYKLRWIKDEATAVMLGGPAWNRNVIDVDPSLFALYATGAPIEAATLATGWPSGTTIDASLNIQDARKLDGLRYYVTGGKKRAFVPETTFEANGFQTRFSWNHASATAALETLKALPSGPDITGPEDALFSLMH